jgi:outer membrane protein OmpA-like peptidoglycan-associated protein
VEPTPGEVSVGNANPERYSITEMKEEDKMRSTRRLAAASTVVLTILAAAAVSQTVRVTTEGETLTVRRNAQAIMYREGDSTAVSMVGTSIAPAAIGKAEVKRKEGRTRIRVEMRNFVNPQSLGPYYTTYVLWAISPEGQADNLAEMPFKRDVDIDVTTPLQTFALIITAEPYSAVKLPSPVVISENEMRPGTKGVARTSRIIYRGDPGIFYVISPDAPSIAADYNTPLIILGARRSVEIARRAGADRYAEAELRHAEIKLAVLEQTWSDNKKVEEKLGGVAREVMHLAEHARELAVERSAEARLNSERQAARNTIAEARSEANQAKQEANEAKDQAEVARQQAAAYRDAMARAQQEADLARQRVRDAQTDADRAKANEELARAQAEQARLEAEQARKDKAAAEQQLFISLSQILDTRREARGLIVSLSDVLFDFNKATLKPGAREKLSKLAGILIAYPGQYRLQIEGHTDSIGSEEYNLRLSQDRAESVRYYLVQAGVHSDRIAEVRGMGKSVPVASNDTPEGRQMNRRVEIVISDLITAAGVSNR